LESRPGTITCARARRSPSCTHLAVGLLLQLAQTLAVLADERAMVLLGDGDLARRLLLKHLDDTTARLVDVAALALEHHRQRAVARLAQLDRALCTVAKMSDEC